MNEIIIIGPDGRQYGFPAGTSQTTIAAKMATVAAGASAPAGGRPTEKQVPYIGWFEQPAFPTGRPGYGFTDPVWGELLDDYGHPSFWTGDITLRLPEGIMPEEAQPYLYANPDQNVRYTVGPDYVPYGVRATSAGEPFENIVLHSTGAARPEWAYIHKGNYNDQGDYIGYYFIIQRDGQVVQVAPLTVRTNGAVGYGDFINANSVHVALAGAGDHTDAQVGQMTELVNTLAEQYGIPADRITTHGFIQSNRDQERNNAALQQVMNNVGAPIPLLTVGTGGQYGTRDDADEMIRLAQTYLGVAQPEPGQPYYTGDVDGEFGPTTGGGRPMAGNPRPSPVGLY